MPEISMRNKVIYIIIIYSLIADMTMDQIDELLKKANFINKQ